MQRMKTYIDDLERMFDASDGPAHSAGYSVRRRFFLMWVVLMSAGAVVWLPICFVTGLWTPAAAPAVYLVLTAANLCNCVPSLLIK